MCTGKQPNSLGLILFCLYVHNWNTFDEISGSTRRVRKGYEDMQENSAVVTELCFISKQVLFALSFPHDSTRYCWFPIRLHRISHNQRVIRLLAV